MVDVTSGSSASSLPAPRAMALSADDACSRKDAGLSPEQYASRRRGSAEAWARGVAVVVPWRAICAIAQAAASCTARNGKKRMGGARTSQSMPM